jgi:ankyrin repeat protein
MKENNQNDLTNNFQFIRYPAMNAGNQTKKTKDDIKTDAPLCTACATGNLELVKTLLEKGFDVNKKDMSNLTPIMHAALFGDRTIIKLLVEHGAKISYALLGIVKAKTNDVEKELVSGSTDSYELSLWRNLLDFLIQEGKKQ